MNNMNIFFILFSIIPILILAIAFIITDNVLTAVIAFLITELIFALIFYKKVQNQKAKDDHQGN